MKKYFLRLFLILFFFSTNIKPEDVVSDYLKKIGLHGIITQTLLIYSLYENWKLSKLRLAQDLRPPEVQLRSDALKKFNRRLDECIENSESEKQKKLRTIKMIDQRAFLIRTLTKCKNKIKKSLELKGLLPDSYLLVHKDYELVEFNQRGRWLFDHISPLEFVERLISRNETPLLVFSFCTPNSTLYHEAKHILDGRSRSYFCAQFAVPAICFTGASIFAARYKRESLTLPTAAALYLSPLLIKKISYTIISRYFEQKADDFIPNNQELLQEEEKKLTASLETKKTFYANNDVEKSSFGAFLCKQLLPDTLGFHIWEMFVRNPNHPSLAARIKRLQNRISDINNGKIKEDDLTTQSPLPKPPLISNSLFNIIETIGMGYGLATQGLYTIFGAKKTLQLMTPLTEKLVSSLTSNMLDALENKISKEISSCLKN